MFEGELDRVRIDAFHGVDNAEKGRHEYVSLGVHDALIVPVGYFRIAVGTIVEHHPFAQVEHVDLVVLQKSQDSASSGI
jgi:hypothetical protein